MCAGVEVVAMLNVSSAAILVILAETVLLPSPRDLIHYVSIAVRGATRRPTVRVCIQQGRCQLLPLGLRVPLTVVRAGQGRLWLGAEFSGRFQQGFEQRWVLEVRIFYLHVNYYSRYYCYVAAAIFISVCIGVSYYLLVTECYAICIPWN